MSDDLQQHQHDYSSSSDSEASSSSIRTARRAVRADLIVQEDIVAEPAAAETETPVALPASAIETEFWMATRQTQCGANLTERMVSFMKQITAAQSEFADKIAAISAAELQRSKNGPNDSAIYAEYWNQMQLAMRLCRTWSASTKEMTAAIGSLLAPMDRIVHVGRARLKESANWNVELNKALSVFHTNVAKRQAKCYKALAVVMTPEYFDQSPMNKSHAVRRAAPTVAKYVEQIDEANAWLTKYMAQRPTLKSRLESLEQKRVEVTRQALTTFASQVQAMGKALTESADEIISGVDSIDDNACKAAFIAEMRTLPTPHLEAPALFEYTLPVPISELGIRAVREPRMPRVNRQDDGDSINGSVQDQATSLTTTPRARSQMDQQIEDKGFRLTTLARNMFGGHSSAQPTPAQRKVVKKPQATEEQPVEEVNDFEEDDETVDDQILPADRSEQVTRFGNITVHQEKPVGRPTMKVARRSAAGNMTAAFEGQPASTA